PSSVPWESTVERVKARGGRARNVTQSVWGECHVVRSHARFQCGVDKNLPVGRDTPDGSAAVAHVEAALMVKRDAGGNAHSFRVRAHGSRGGNAVHGPVIAG